MNRLRPAERMLLGYFAVATIVAFLRLGGEPAIWWVLAAHGLCLILIWLVTRESLGSTGQVLRQLYPLLLLGALYPALDILNGFGTVAVHDQTVRGWEVALFGREVSRLWWQQAPSIWWSTVLHSAYFLFYPIVLAPVTVFLLQGRGADAERSVRWILSAFLGSYIVFLLFPVAGPYYEFPRPAAWFVENPAARLVYATLSRGSAYGAAFPSSHVATALVASATAFRGSPALGWVLLIPSLLLTVGVVYCQMHYAVDALAGMALALLVVVGWSWWERGEQPARVSSEG